MINGLQTTIGLVIGLAAGGGLVWLALKGRLADARERLADLNRETETVRREAERNVQRLTAELDRLRDEAAGMVADQTALAAARAGLAAELEAEKRTAREKQAALAKAEEELRNSFASLSAQALQSNARDFLRLAEETFKTHQAKTAGEMARRQQEVEGVVKPLRDSLSLFRTQITEMERNRQEAYGSLSQQVQNLIRTESRLQTETGNLVKALRRPQVRGRWGEVQLRRVVEFAGMVEHCDFMEQATMADGDNRQRPDMIVRLPGDKQIVVDAKTPLDAYLTATEAEDEAQRKQLMADHVRQIKAKITDLGDKRYWDRLETTPELVVMFLPNDAILYHALETEPGLQEFGWDRKVLLATPSLLIALLRTVAYDWRRLHIQENAEEIAREARDLYNRLATMAGHFSTVGKRLGSAVDSYNKSVGSLERSVLPKARRFLELGVQPKKVIDPPSQLEQTARLITVPELKEEENGEK